MKDKLYTREFEGALVVVNPEKERRDLALPREYRAWGGNAVKSLSMEPQSGVVLMK